jgi:Cu+-exporting ATPase
MSTEFDVVNDPVCGMAITRTTAISIEYAGRTFHFCESTCAEIFQEEPERWIEDQGKPERD